MIAGTPPNITGENVATATGHKTGGGPEGRKASGLLMVDGVLYMWVRNLKKDGTGSSLAWSKDHSKTWAWADWSFPEVGYPVWMNAGRNYEAAQDGYAYVYSPDTPSAYNTSDHILLARVPEHQIGEKEGYEFFAGLGDAGQARWSSHFENRKPVFTDPGHCYRPEVTYAPDLNRYLYLQLPAPKELPGFTLWERLKSLGVVTSCCVRDEKETIATRYYIRSLGVDVKRFAHAVRGHWSIENACHWVLDMTCREDESRTRERHLRENLAWLNRFVLSLLKQHPGRQSLVMKRRSCGWSDTFLMEVATGPTC
jgi:predicted transposase YbfD/YdcC